MRNNIMLDLKKMIDVNTPIIYICDHDYARVDDLICNTIGKTRALETYEWSSALGVCRFYDKDEVARDCTLTDFLYGYVSKPKSPNGEVVVVLREPQDFIEDPKVKGLLAYFSQRKLYDRKFNTSVIVVSSVVKVPVELEKYVSFLEILPLGEKDRDEINALIDEHTDVNMYHSLSDADRVKLMPSLQGLTPFEIDRVIDMAMSNNGTLSADDNEMILKEKKQMVKKSGLLELLESNESIDDIGGMECLKSYIEQKAKIFLNLPKAHAYGVPTPKGVFIVGMPGCGKSLCAKVSSSLFKAPLLKLDMGSMMGKYVGESEGNLRRAIKIAEAAAPCVLWIDEIEKAFSGVGGNNDIMTRMFGYFLSWLQDKTSSVYVIATANNASDLPPELKRKGRFDEIFCVNLPNEKEREQIFRVHLRKKPNLPEFTDLKEVVKKTEGFNGADIESVVNEAIEDCFINSLDSDCEEKLTIKKLVEVANKTVSITKSCSEQIMQMENIFEKSNFKNASED